MELGCKVFGVCVRLLAKFDKLLDFIEVLLHSSFQLLLCVSHVRCFMFPNLHPFLSHAN